MYVDLRVEIEKRHRVRYSVFIMFHEEDYDRVCGIVMAAPDDHELVLTDQKGEVVLGRWSCVIPERALRKRPV